MNYLVAIDQGTTGTTVIVLDEALNVHARVNQEFPQIYPQAGWVEHDPEAIWASTLGALQGALTASGIDPMEIAALGITNQRETSVVWEKDTGRALHNAIVWQCRRTASRCEALRADGHSDLFARKTGLVLDPYFSGTKLGWILDTHNAHERARAGKLCFGTIDTYLVWRLTAGASFVTDVSNASRTLMMDIERLEWDSELLDILNIPRELLPEIRGNAEVYGHTKGIPGLPDGIPIAGMAGDQQSALFGQACFEAGEAKCTFGTGAFLLMNTGSEIIRSSNKMLSTVAWQIGGETRYALEGSAFVAGATVQWLRDGLQFFESAHEVEALAAQVEDSNGVVFVPALTGLGAPHWKPDARGVIWGLTRGVTRAHIARATLDGIAHQNTDILQAMEADLGARLGVLKVDGGAAANNLLMQTQANLLNCELVRPQMLETTALGAAMLAGLGVGIFSDLSALQKVWRKDASFSPDLSDEDRQQARALWAEGLSRV